MSGQPKRSESSAVLTRRLLPAMVVLILVSASVRWLGERAGLYGTDVGLALMVSLMMLLTVLLVAWTARVLNEGHQRSMEALRESELRFRSMIENSYEVTAIVNPDGTVRYQSPSVERILGYSHADLTGRAGYAVVHPDDVEGVRAALAELLAERGASVLHRVRVLTKDGDVRVLSVAAENLLAEPSFGGIVVSGRDITAQVELEEQLRRGQRLEAVGRLASGVAHDFNNLLVVIQGYAELVRSRLRETGEDAEGLDHVIDASERAAVLVREMLAFSREQVLDPRQVNLNAVLRGLEGMLRPLVGDAVDLRLELEPGLSDVFADSRQIEQAIMNLAANGRDAMPDGGTLTIATANVAVEHEAPLRGEGLVEPGRYATLTVVDEGVGMDDETRARIFEPFFSTKGPERGTGLGLATVYGFVTQSGGSVVVESEPGRGSAFTVYLPAATGVAAVPQLLPG